jgi:rubrerythrin
VNKTSENLQAAFAGESQASRKYLYFAEKAEEEGYKQIARLFRAASDAETVHARNHLKVMQGIKSTRDNLKDAIGGENYEFTEMYPEFMKQAEAEGDIKAKGSFNLANKVEQIHHRLYQTALSILEKGQAMAEDPIYVCQVCGNTVEGEVPDKCPICGAPKKMFKLID